MAARSVRVAGVLAAVIATLGCGAGSGARAGGESDGRAVDPFLVTLPDKVPLSRADIDALLAALEGDGEPPSLPVPASVFHIGSSEPRRDDPQWVELVTTVTRVRDTAVAKGWALVVEGWADAATGSPAVNARLSGERARVTCRDIVGVHHYPAERVAAVGRGAGGHDPSHRRVVVRFVRADGPEFADLVRITPPCDGPQEGAL